MSQTSKYDYLFFVAFWVSVINHFKPEAGWSVMPEVFDALVPAIGAYFSHLTMLVKTAFKPPTEQQIRTWMAVYFQKREIKKQLDDPMHDVEYQTALKQRYALLSKTKLDSIGIDITPADKK